MNRLDVVTLHSGRNVDYDWTSDGLISQVSYGGGIGRVYAYDNADRVTSIKNNLGAGDSEEYNYTYDANSNRRDETRRQNGEIVRQVTYSYDELDRLTTESYASMRGRGLKAEYFDNTDFTSLKSIRIDSTLDFSWAGSPVAGVEAESFSVRWTGSIEAERSEEYTFYARSDEGARVYINNQLVIDDAGNPDAREDNGKITMQAGQKYDIKVEYKDVSGAAEMKLSWESASQSKQVIPTARLYPTEINLTYGYDAVGNRLSETGVGIDAATINRVYRYDDLNRLTEITGDREGTLTFNYDANGNLRTQTHGSTATRYEYDLRDQLRRVMQGTSEIASFDYDFDRRRISKSSFGIALNYVYAGDRVVNEYGAAGQLVNRYDYGVDLVSGELGGEGERLYYSDALGSVTALGLTTGGASSRYEYSAWGESIAAGASLNRIGYTGQRRDEETGLMALGNGERYYASLFGQFIQQDSFAGFHSQPQSLNRHSYVVNNPTKHIDPTGHIAPLVVLAAIVIGALTGAAIGAVGGFVYGAGINAAYQLADIVRGEDKSFEWREVFDAGLEGAKYGVALGALTGALGAIGFGAAAAAGLFAGGTLATAGSISVNLEQGRWDYALIDTVTFLLPFKSAKGRRALRDSLRDLGQGPRATPEIVAESRRTVGQAREGLRSAEGGIRRETNRWIDAWESSREPESRMALAGGGDTDISGLPDLGRPAKALSRYLESRSTESRGSGRGRSEEVQSTAREATGADDAIARGEGASETKRGVRVLDYDSYRKLQNRELPGDGLDLDHAPSFGAIKTAVRKALGRNLTAAEELALKNRSNALVVPHNVHRLSPTYKGKNTIALQAADAANLRRAAGRDFRFHYKNLVKEGYDPNIVKEALQGMHRKNRADGIYDLYKQ
jgi:RHS repeat-associated protein